MSIPFKASKNRGQAVIEFAMVSLLFVSMLLLTYNVILAFCVQQYISYATFMSARAYQASAKDSAAQLQNAKQTLITYFPDMLSDPSTISAYDFKLSSFSKNKILARITRVEFPQANSLNVGALAPSQIKVSFKVPFAQLPLGDALKPYAWLELSAESALGREVTQEECQRFFKERYSDVWTTLKSAGAPLSSVAEGWDANMEDNGC